MEYNNVQKPVELNPLIYPRLTILPCNNIGFFFQTLLQIIF